MRRTLPQLLLFCFLVGTLARAAQQKPPAPPPDKSQGQTQTPAQDDANNAPLPATVDEDIQVGTFYMHKGDIDAAIPRFEDAIRQQPKLAKPRLLLAEAYEKKGDKATAVKYYREYLRAFPNASDAKRIQEKIDKLTAR